MKRSVTVLAEHEAVAFLAARRSTDRSACGRWCKAQGIEKTDATVYEAAKARWRSLPWLLDPIVHNVAARLLPQVLGAQVTDATLFPSMLWFGGASDTYGGNRFKGTLGDFITHVLEARAQKIAPKRTGWVVTPTSNTDGHRINESTIAMHALNLDCDGLGDWGLLLKKLDTIGLAYIAYQSGGWSPTSPKWHVLIPLARPFDTSSPEKIEAWKSAYTSARVIFGALAALPGEGFDPTVETPCIPIFITERRDENDPPRIVIKHLGVALDIEALAAALPAFTDDRVFAPRANNTVESAPLGDQRLEQITAALVVPMSKILTSRRDLYMALPGVLLDRGLTADDVRTIIEEISFRCPGDPSYTRSEIESKHREHVHCADTTIDKHERGEPVTRIGTIQESWPEVAQVIDEQLPNPEWLESIAWLESMRGGKPVTVRPDLGTPGRVVTGAPVPLVAASTVAPVDFDEFKKQVRRVKNAKMQSEEFDQKVRGVILSALLDGHDLVPRAKGEPVQNAKGTAYDRDSAIDAAVWAITLCVDVEHLSLDVIKTLFRRSAKSMIVDSETIETIEKKVKVSFERAVDKRRENEHEIQVRKDTLRKSLSREWEG